MADSAEPVVAFPRPIPWARLFSPRTVLVVGASETEGSQGRGQWVFLRDRLEPRGVRVVPVHPKQPSVLATPAVASVLDEPGADVAVIMVRDPLPVVEQCREAGIAFVVVFSAGFSELGTDEGRAKEAALRSLGGGPTWLIGPNTNSNIFEPWRRDLPGKRMAIVTQSGMQGRPISQGEVLGIPIESWATLGNEADLEWADFVAHYAQQPEVGVVTSYVEGFVDGRSLMQAADVAAQHGVPIVLVKIGRSEVGRRMATAHTGHLAGSDAVHDAVFRQVGITRVDDLDELIEISGMFCHVPPVRASDRPGVAIYAMSGGTASHLVDLCGAAGVPVPRLAERTIEELRRHIPWYLHVENPVDTGGAIVMTPAGRAVLEAMLDDEHTSVLLAPITGVFPGMSESVADDVIALHAQARKPILVTWSSPVRDDTYRRLCGAGVPVFHSFGATVRGAQALLAHHEHVTGYRSPFRDAPVAVADPPRRITPADAADEVATKRMLAEFGVPVVEEHVATSADDAVAAARAIGGPVAMKILSPDIAHKSDLGLVALHVAGDVDVRAQYGRITADAAAAVPEARLHGVVVAPMVTDGVAEVILGVSRQAPFGPTIMFGLGGVMVEVFRDVSFGVAPFTRAHAQRMVLETRGSVLLQGFRGRPAGDVDALVDAIMALQRLVLEAGDDLEELDVNPLVVRPAGLGVVAVDALLVLRDA